MVPDGAHDTRLARGLRRFALDDAQAATRGQALGRPGQAGLLYLWPTVTTPLAHQRASGQYRTDMRAPPRVVICPLVAAALLVSGCGSAKKASTTITENTNLGTSAPANAGTAPKGTSAKESQHAKTAVTPSATAAKPEQNQAAATEEFRRHQRQRQANERAAGTRILGAAESDLPRNRRYPKELQGKFLRACKAAKGSTSSCECIIVRQEANLKLERGRTLAELLALELAFAREHASLEDIRRRRIRSPHEVRKIVRQCR